MLAYFDCFSGAGGDMIVASLIHAGADEGALRDGLASLGVGGYTLHVQDVTTHGFSATRFHVVLSDQAHQPQRHLADIKDILAAGALSDRVRRRATAVFERLAEAEATVHGTSVDKIHFHEVGAVDAIVDVVGAVLALELLGVERVVCSPIPVGSGTVKCEHGVIPVPAPATVELLKGVPLASGDTAGEVTTPTAAAVLTTLADAFGPVPPMRIESIGLGAGMREGTTLPNMLRVFIGHTTDTAATDADADIDDVAVLETNLDDTSPQIIAHCMDRLFSEGALEVYTVPIVMKKSRHGVVLTVLCRHGDADRLERVVFAETPTLGIRRHSARRTKLPRRHETVATRFGDIRMKVGRRRDLVTAAPEFADCRAAATRHGVALRDVLAAANAAWAARTGG
ncbi:MAG: nickel pincer cofactor biosynthesis protein LarC [Phycisphaerae bacterium]